MDRDREACFEAGMDYFLAKAVAIQELGQILDHLYRLALQG